MSARVLSGNAMMSVMSRRGWFALIALVELAGLRVITQWRFAALYLDGEPMESLWTLHTATKFTLMVAVMLLVVAAIERRLGGPPLVPPSALGPILAVHAAALVVLVATVTSLPYAYAIDTAEGVPLWRYAVASVAFLLWQASTFALVASRAVLTGLGLRTSAFMVAGAAIILVVFFDRSSIMRVLPAFIESSTLSLALVFYDVIGGIEPMLEYKGGVPIMSAPGFAIAIADSCAGYQGIVSSGLLMAGLITLEWPALHHFRAIVLGLAAVAAVFLFNAFRIALLFHIGVTYSPEMAVEGFHSYFGTLSLLAVVALAMLALQHPLFRRDAVSTLPAGPRIVPQENAAAGLIVPLAAYLGIGMVLGLFSTGFNWIYPVSVICGLMLMWLWQQVIVREFTQATGLAGAAMGVGMGVAVYGLWMALVPVDPEADSAFAAALGSVPVSLAAGWMLMRLIGFSVVVPVLEELAFRGGLYRLVSGWVAPVAGPRIAALAAFVLTSLAFGAMHSDVVAGTLAGAGFAVLVLRTGRVGDAIIAHAVTNFLLAVTAMATGHWSLW